ncbi:hypothetical protein AQJ43_11085 [Streptomyces avermitilis]|uniref:DUF1990 domain-containing protein n=2 Tax=Streptomyces avermitilis TaxID=33903 RepID=Q82P49_STRAW|nr:MULTISPECIES: DUF1990 domain-containing protein [Streptomyces]KUN54796.1 hypothetical protein AQJ43_11085 [Streptomyces avermitilis]MYS96717.1 DUF1990 family protein [Streptomyces sp. SID5469]OOV21850.1 DUF1990 domain-containing protein [Streptomyces avermitilis]BAC68794.1 hypothetical protein SAVERM_1084 [Streptomyces avermitilis MA-4680 = NBRC 14893]BBJ48718.1 hypothetical protein SAVMC3_13470 [Streptomyces avermitilis]
MPPHSPSDLPRAPGPPPAEALSYGPAGATCPGDESWHADGEGYRRYDRTVVIGHGDAHWRAAADAVLHWGIKRRSGFRVTPRSGAGERVTEGAEYRITAAIGPLAVHEPVRVVAVVVTPERCGFAYGTLPGHPVSGEEAFVVHRTPDGAVALTLRSLTRPAPSGPWRALFPLLLVAQRFYRRRYLRSLRAVAPR